MRHVLLILFTFIFIVSLAQDSEKEKLRQIEQQKEYERNRKVKMQMDSGIYFLDRGEYVLADEKLKFALSNLRSIPSDLTFYFGKNSYFIDKYKQSVDWLTKYIQLKGTTGQYSAEATEYLKKAEQALLEERQAESVKAAEIFSKDYTIDCGPAGKVTCPVCSGTTLIIKKNYLGETYKACPYCDQHGTLTCEEYNLLLRGQLKASTSR